MRPVLLLIFIFSSFSVQAATLCSRPGYQSGVAVIDDLYQAVFDEADKADIASAVQRFSQSSYSSSHPDTLKKVLFYAASNFSTHSLQALIAAGVSFSVDDIAPVSNIALNSTGAPYPFDWRDHFIRSFFLSWEARCQLITPFSRYALIESMNASAAGKDPMLASSYPEAFKQDVLTAYSRRQSLLALRARVIALVLQAGNVPPDYDFSGGPLAAPNFPLSLLAYAVRDDDVALFRYLLAQGVSINSDGFQGAALLNGSLLQLKLAVAVELLAANAAQDIDAPTIPAGTFIFLPQDGSVNLPVTTSPAKLVAYLATDEGKKVFRSIPDLNVNAILYGQHYGTLPAFLQAPTLPDKVASTYLNDMQILENKLQAAHNAPAILFERELIDNSLEKPQKYARDMEKNSQANAIPDMNFTLTGSYQVVAIGSLPHQQGSNFSHTTLLNESLDRGSPTHAKLVINQAKTERETPVGPINVITDISMNGHGGLHKRSWPKSDENDTASISYNLQGKLTIPACTVGPQRPCFPHVSVSPLGWALPQDASWLATQGTKRVNLLSPEAASNPGHFNLTQGDVVISLNYASWFKNAGPGTNHASNAKSNMAVYLIWSGLGTSHPHFSNVVQASRLYAQHKAADSTLQADVSSGLAKQCVGQYLKGSPLRYERRFKELYFCLYALRTALDDYKTQLSSLDAAELQIAIHYLSSLARTQFRPQLLEQARQVRNALKLADLADIDSVLQQSLSARLDNKTELAELLLQFTQLPQLDDDLKSQLNDFISKLTSDDQDQLSATMLQFRNHYLTKLEAEIEKLRLLTLELAQYEILSSQNP